MTNKHTNTFIHSFLLNAPQIKSTTFKINTYLTITNNPTIIQNVGDKNDNQIAPTHVTITIILFVSLYIVHTKNTKERLNAYTGKNTMHIISFIHKQYVGTISSLNLLNLLNPTQPKLTNNTTHQHTKIPQFNHAFTIHITSTI